MAQFCCNCLNVTVNVTADYKSQTRPASNLFTSRSCSSHPLLVDKSLYEVQLDVAGIIVQLRSLVVKTVLEDWVLATCANCSVLVYITHSIKMDRTLVSQSLLSSREAIKRVTEHPNFSGIFHILLHNQEEPDSYSRKRVSSMSFGREDPGMNQLHQQMKSYLTQEEEAMEHRIRLYEKQQRHDFQTLQEKAHQQRRALFAAITKAQDTSDSEVKGSSTTRSSSKSQDSLTPGGVTTPTLTAGSRDTASAQPRRSGSNNRQSEQQQTGKKTLTITLQDEIPLNIVQVAGEQLEEDDESMFNLDGFETEEEQSREAGFEERGNGYQVATDMAFPQSDDEEISTDDSSYRDLCAVNPSSYSTSVPLNIPMFSKPPPAAAVQPSSPSVVTRRGESGRVAGGGEGELEWGELGNCIRQLALSVQDTGMFGDLPRPRMYEK